MEKASEDNIEIVAHQPASPDGIHEVLKTSLPERESILMEGGENRPAFSWALSDSNIEPATPRGAREESPRILIERGERRPGFSLARRDSSSEPSAPRGAGEEIRGFLMVLATLTGSISYSAGLNPPGGFWQDNSDGHVAGTAILNDQFYKRYMAFLYFNTTSFVMSILIIILSSISDFYYSTKTINILECAVVLDVIGLIGAYIAGSYRDVKSSIYVITLNILMILVAGYFWLSGVGSFLSGLCMKRRKNFR